VTAWWTEAEWWVDVYQGVDDKWVWQLFRRRGAGTAERVDDGRESDEEKAIAAAKTLKERLVRAAASRRSVPL
jgi:hypothetical protein